MKSGYLVAGVSLLQAARAIPALITTVMNCPDVMTVTQTVYPPGWTNTGPMYNSMSTYRGGPVENQQQQCTPAAGAVTTSWETNYATTTAYFSQYGMYPGPAGCPTQIIVYKPTTVTCSQALSTGWVGYVSDIACNTCTATTLAGIKPSYNVTSGTTYTYVTIWTEVYMEQGTSTQASILGQVYTTNTIPTALYPYPAQCNVVATPAQNTAGGQNTAGPNTAGGNNNNPGYSYSSGAYPSIDFSNPSIFDSGESISIVSAVPTPESGAPTTYATPAATSQYQSGSYTTPSGGTYTTPSGGGYPSINYNDPNIFSGGQGISSRTGAVDAANTRPANTNTANANAANTSPSVAASGTPSVAASGTGGAVNYPSINFNDPNVFAPPTTSISIVSETITGATTTVTSDFTIPTDYTKDYSSINISASSFYPDSGTVQIVSLTPAQTFETPTTTESFTTFSVNYPSLDFNNPNLFTPVDPNPSSTPTSSK